MGINVLTVEVDLDLEASLRGFALVDGYRLYVLLIAVCLLVHFAFGNEKLEKEM